MKRETNWLLIKEVNVKTIKEISFIDDISTLWLYWILNKGERKESLTLLMGLLTSMRLLLAPKFRTNHWIPKKKKKIFYILRVSEAGELQSCEWPASWSWMDVLSGQTLAHHSRQAFSEVFIFVLTLLANLFILASGGYDANFFEITALRNNHQKC